MKVLIKIFLIFGVICVLIIFLGILILNIVKPENISLKNWITTGVVDLGIKSNQEQYSEFKQNIGIEVKSSDCNINCSPKYSKDTVLVEKEISNEQGSALINGWGYESRNAPFSNVQMKVNEDNSVDFSAQISTSKVSNLLSISPDISNSNKEIIKEYIEKLGTTFPLYAHGKLNIENNNVDINITTIKVGILPIPSGLIKQYKTETDNYIENRIKYVEGLNVEKLEFKDGKTFFKGTLPKVFEYNK